MRQEYQLLTGYLASVMNDTEGGSWEMVLNSHRQILHMIEQAQLKWEDVGARTARERQGIGSC